MTFQVTPKKKQELFSKGEYLVTTVDFDTVNNIIDWIMSNRPSKKKFTILINSSGGDPAAVIYLASFLATLDSKVKIKGIAFGECGSAAFALLQCCHERIAVKYCSFFIHHVNSKIEVNCQDFDLQKIEAELMDMRQTEEELIQLQCSRSGMSRENWMLLADEGEQIRGRAITSSRALELRLIDNIIERHAIF